VPRILLFYPQAEDHSLPAACSVRMPVELYQWPAEELARIRSILKKLTEQRVDNPEDAEDLVQDTLLTMTVRCPSVDIEKGLLVWGLGVLRRKVGNYYRRTQRHGAVVVESLEGSAAEHAKALPSAEASVRHTELAALVDGILSQFSPQEKAVMDLLLAGLPTGEIAEQLHPERYQNVVNRVHRGRRKLSKELARYGYTRPAEGRRVRAQRRTRPAIP